MNFCSNCGARASAGESVCSECGETLSNEVNVVNATDSMNQNNASTVGFVLSLVSLFLPVPIIDTIIGVIALVFSIMGLKTQKNTLAIFGIVISLIAIIGSIQLLLTGGYVFF